MTGYGKALNTSENMDISVEIKSVNSRYLDFFPKTPRVLNAFDDELSKLIKQACVRGRVTLMCSIDYHESSKSGLTLNIDKIREYIKVAEEIQFELNSDVPVSVDQLMKSQDIYISNDKNDLSEELKSTFFNAVNDAIEQLDKIRNAEGENLKKDLEARLKIIGTYVSQIELIASKQRGSDFERYKKRISELLEDVSLDLDRGLYRPFHKCNENLKYVNSRSNHPKVILNSIVKSVSNRISKLSANIEFFKLNEDYYNEALGRAGYKEKIEYMEVSKLSVIDNRLENNNGHIRNREIWVWG